jgi:predicted nuclease of restriction endonuclease-like (RecB) superfamily
MKGANVTTSPSRDDYAAALAEAKRTIQAARTKAVLAVSSELITLYWDLGRLILDRQQAEGKRSRIIQRLSNDLRAEFPHMSGLSPGNLDYMRRFAAAWPERTFSQQLAGKIPWGHNMILLDKLNDPDDRQWYARKTIEHGWSRAVLEHQIMGQLRRRAGAAPTNFERLLPVGESELMQQLVKDPYHLDFLGLTDQAVERDVERQLVANVERFLLELGAGFAFMGRQYRLDIDGDELFIDLLFFHTPSLRHLVIELKRGKVTGADIGQLNLYVAAVDDILRKPGHADTIGLLLCTSKNERVVRYALSRTTSPMAVSGYTYTQLPELERAVVPDETALIEIVAQALDTINDPTDDAAV